MILNNLPRKHEYAAPSNPVTNFSKFFRCSIVNILQYRNSGMKKKKKEKERGRGKKRETYFEGWNTWRTYERIGQLFARYGNERFTDDV